MPKKKTKDEEELENIDSNSEQENEEDKEKKSKKSSSKKPGKAPKNFDMLKAIRNEKLYKANIKRRDVSARKHIDEEVESEGKASILPGQLIMFDYFEPATKDKLEYYDAMPCTIFFGIINTKNGQRVLGFNIHYYPPRIRYQLMNRIYEIFKPIYAKNFDKPLKKEMEHFNYKMLISQLQKASLDFGIREYIPGLMGSIKPIPVSEWPKAVFTEGHFRKETRQQILNYWKNKSSDINKKRKKIKKK